MTGLSVLSSGEIHLSTILSTHNGEDKKEVSITLKVKTSLVTMVDVTVE